MVQDPPFSPTRHDISDQGALRPALAMPGRREAIGPWFLALSLPAIDNVSDAFFRLDCRASDAGCAEASMSWHAQVHGIVGTLVTGIAFVIALNVTRLIEKAV